MSLIKGLISSWSEFQQMSQKDRTTLLMLDFDSAYDEVAEGFALERHGYALHPEVIDAMKTAIERWNALCEGISHPGGRNVLTGSFDRFVDDYFQKYAMLLAFARANHLGIYPQDFPIDAFNVDSQKVDGIITTVQQRARRCLVS